MRSQFRAWQEYLAGAAPSAGAMQSTGPAQAAAARSV
jgi:hypothetical protein